MVHVYKVVKNFIILSNWNKISLNEKLVETTIWRIEWSKNQFKIITDSKSKVPKLYPYDQNGHIRSKKKLFNYRTTK